MSDQELNALHLELSTFDYPNFTEEQIIDLIRRASDAIGKIREERKNQADTIKQND